jgi:elongation factor P hydroxylase
MPFLIKTYYANAKEDGILYSRLLDKYCKNINTIELCELIVLFNDLFYAVDNTRLIGGAEEPEYRPVDAQHSYNRIIFTRDYISSALHEVAHWCVAGPARRQRVDYGYWYIPDGRNLQQQALFEKVEIKPQALEWIFSEVCGIKFRISVDNLDADDQGSDADLSKGIEPSLLFKQRLLAQTHQYCLEGVNERAEKWISALMALKQVTLTSQHSQICERPFAISAAAFTLSALM